MSDWRKTVTRRRHINLGLAGVVLLLCVACGSSRSGNIDDGPVGSVNVDGNHCVEYAGYPVVWRDGYRLDEGTVYPPAASSDNSWGLEQSSFSVISGYWPLTPNFLFHDLDPAARECVDPGTRWVVLADAPNWNAGRWQVPFNDPSTFDQELWDAITAHPWQLDRFGPPDSSSQAPHYRGVVRFTDELAVTASACDTRPNVVFLRGEALAPLEWPTGQGTMVCVPPPGVEPLPDGEPTYLPIGGALEIRDGDLVVTYSGVEYWYVPISEEQFVGAFGRDAFFDLGHPLTVLERYAAESFDILDDPPTSDTTRTTEPDEASTTP